MRYLLSISLSVVILLLNGCTSGVVSSNAGATGTNPGTTGLLFFAILVPETLSSDAFPSDCDAPPDGVIEQLIETDSGDITITVSDPSGIYTTQAQGVTFESYTVSFVGLTSNAPVLSPRTFALTIPLPLLGATTATATRQIVLVDLDTTKREYRAQDSGSPNSYRVTVTYHGRDFVNGSPVVLVVTTTLEIGDFCPSDN